MDLENLTENEIIARKELLLSKLPKYLSITLNYHCDLYDHGYDDKFTSLDYLRGYAMDVLEYYLNDEESDNTLFFEIMKENNAKIPKRFFN